MAIKITLGSKDYTLEFNRASITKMERQGFNVLQVDERPLSSMIHLFKGSFLMHHPKESEEHIEEIFRHVPEDQRPALLRALMEEFAKPVNSLYKPSEDDKGNVVWETVGNNK